MQSTFTEDHVMNAEGFITAYMHTEDLEFVQVGPNPKQGYFKAPKAPLQEMHVKNLIVSLASVFMAKRMAPGTSWGNGINYLELGTGVGNGTTQSPQVESSAQTALRVPLIRKPFDSWTFIDASGNPVSSDQNVIQLTTTFVETEANSAIVEMGLFGGDASTTLGSGHMFNYKTFPVWNKQSGMKLTVVWKLTF